MFQSSQWRHNGHDGVSNHQPHDCLLNHLFRRRSKKTSKFRVTGLCEGNSPVTGEFPAKMDSNAENVSIWWRHHDAANYIVTMIYNSLWSRISCNNTITLIVYRFGKRLLCITICFICQKTYLAFQNKLAQAMIAHALSPCVARPSTTTVLIMCYR